MRVLVCGGRDYNNERHFNIKLQDVITDSLSFDLDSMGPIYDWYKVVIICGAARGADSLAIKFSHIMGLKLESYPADWASHGKSAGPIRNQQMLDDGKPDLVVAFPGGTGTAHMIKIAREAGIPVKFPDGDRR